MTGISITDTFEGADGTALTTATDSNVSTVFTGPDGYGTVLYSAADTRHGSSGVRFTTVAGGNPAGAAVRYDTPDLQYKFSVSFWYKTPATPMTSGSNIVWFQNTAGHHGFCLNWRQNSAGVWGYNVGDGANTYQMLLPITSVSNNTWYRFTLALDLASTTNATAVAKVYNTAGTMVGSTSTSSGNGGGYPIQFLAVGIYGIGYGPGSVAMDDFQLVTQSNVELPAYVPAPNQPPTTSVGGPYTTSVGNAITLVGTAADGDGVVSTVAWSPQDWPGWNAATPTSPPYVGNSGSSNASFTPSAPGVYRFTFTATDNLGASSSAVAVAYVTDTSAVPISTTANYGWTGTYDLLSDANDATYVESPASATSGAGYTARLAPLAAPDSFSLTIRAYLSVASPGATVTVNLLEGTTVRKTWSVSPTTTVADYVLSMSSAEIATVGSWNTLDVQTIWQTTS